jgi:hypothetical protein
MTLQEEEEDRILTKLKHSVFPRSNQGSSTILGFAKTYCHAGLRDAGKTLRKCNSIREIHAIDKRKDKRKYWRMQGKSLYSHD